MLRHWSIRTQLLTLTLAVALPAAGVIAYGIYDAERESLAQAQSQVRNVAAGLAGELTLFLRDNEALLARIAQRPLIRALDPQRCDPAVREYVALRPEFTMLAVRDLRGNAICSYLANPPGAERVAAFPWFQEGVRSDGFRVSGAFLGQQTGRWVSVLSYPVRNHTGTITGLIALPVDLAPLQQRVMSVLPKEAIGRVLDREGYFLMRSLEPEKWVGKQGRIPGVPDEFWSQREGFIRMRGMDGVLRLYAFTTVAGADWRVFVGIAEDVVLAAHRQRLTISVLIGLVVLLAAAGAGWRISRAIAAPIRKLEATAVAVAGGDLSARASESGATEIGRVSQEFNRMLDARERAEAALRLANERYALAASTGDVWDWNIVSNEISFPQEFWRRLGYGESQTGNPLIFFESILHPEDLVRWRRAVKDHITRRVPYELDYRARTKSGEYRGFHTRGQAVWDAGGRATYMAGTTFDITERELAEAQQQELNRRIAAILESVSDGFVAFDREWRYTYVNTRAAEMFGGSAESLLGRNYYAEYPEAAGTPFEQAYRKAMTEHVPVFLEAYAAPLNRWYENHIYPTPEGISIFFHDITERKRAEDALRESEGRYRALVEWSPEAIAVHGDGKLLYLNPAASKMFGTTSAQDLVGKPILDLVHPDFHQIVLARVKNTTDHGVKVPMIEERFIKLDGTAIDVEVQGTSIVYDGEPAIHDSMHDITERKRAAAALRKANERLRALSARLIEVQEAERAAISRELHDEIGQSLTALKLGAQGLARRLEGGAAESLATIISLADRTLTQTRSLSLDLRPPQLDHLGLAATLRDTLQRVAAPAGIEARLLVEPEDIILERGLATAAYRVAQEALTNAVRHAAPRHIAVQLRATRDALLLAVSDDGKGFDLEEARSRAFKGASVGLFGMEERTALAGGELKIITRPGQGTRVQARFPLAPRAAGSE